MKIATPSFATCPLVLARLCVASLALLVCSVTRAAPVAPGVPILPIPQQVELLAGRFKVDASVVIALPKAPAEHDVFLAQNLAAELAQRYGLALRTERLDALPTKRAIVIGSQHNPLVQAAEKQFALTAASARPAAEGYILLIRPDVLVVDGTDDAGAFYGLQSVRQLLMHADSALELPAVLIRDWPYKPLRGVKLYLPGRDNLAYTKRFLSDFMALYKFNFLCVEFNGGMRSDRHPEINAGWIDAFKDLAYSRRDRPTGARGEYQDSPNQDVADGGVLEKAEVADLVAWAQRQHIEFVPEVPSLTHSFYLLTRHRELADPAQANWEWPDAYDSRNPATYRLYFDILDEILDVTKPRVAHVGHDEWRVPLDNRPDGDSAARRRQYASDLKKIHDHLAAKNIRTAIYGDHLLETVRGEGFSQEKTRAGLVYQWPGGLTSEQVVADIPKDILVFNWFWREGKKGEGEDNEITVEKWGFQQVFNNFTPDIINYDRRSARQSVIGGVPSSWAATTEFNFGKDMLFDYIGCANLVWSTHWPSSPELSDLVQAEMPMVRRSLSGRSLPSEDGDAVEPIALKSQVSVVAEQRGGLDPAQLRMGALTAGHLQFQLSDPQSSDGPFAVVAGVSGPNGSPPPAVSGAIPIGADVSSLIFLHALARPATNMFAYKYVYNFDDSADLMGCYEIVYEDGFVTSIPLRYGYNILEWSWGRHETPRNVCYGANAVELGKSPEARATFFALEWPNPRLGRKIKEVRLRGSINFESGARSGKAMANNAIFLRALSVVRPRGFPEPVKAQGEASAP